MAETGGEYTVFWIAFAIIAFVIISIFAYFLLFGFGFSDSSLCFASSGLRNFINTGLCVTNVACLSSTLNSLGLVPPLYGCSPSTSAYSGSNANTAFSGIVTALSSCWYQYGGDQGWAVIQDQAPICSEISLNLNSNVTFYNFTKYLNVTAYSSTPSCVGHTAEQACPNYAKGYACDTQQPNLCELSTNNYFQCEDSVNYNAGPGQVINIPLNTPNKATTAANNMSEYLCSQVGCSFVPTADSGAGACENASGSINACTQYYLNFCSQNPTSEQGFGKYNCSVVYNSVTDSFYAPASCTLTENINSGITSNMTFFNYLQPGINLFMTWVNKTSGAYEYVRPGGATDEIPYTNGSFKTLSSPDAINRSISHAQLYILFLNSLSGTRFVPSTISLPSECAPFTYLNNYPGSCYDYCARAAIFYYGLYKGAGRKLGITTVSALAVTGIAAGSTTAACSSNSGCNQYILQPGYNDLTNVISTGLFTTSGLSQCVSCISGYLSNAFGHPGVLGENEMYMCAVVS